MKTVDALWVESKARETIGSFTLEHAPRLRAMLETDDSIESFVYLSFFVHTTEVLERAFGRDFIDQALSTLRDKLDAAEAAPAGDAAGLQWSEPSEEAS